MNSAGNSGAPLDSDLTERKILALLEFAKYKSCKYITILH